MDFLERIAHYKGTPREIGAAAGRRMGGRLERNIAHYIARREHETDMQELRRGALPWLRGLPARFQEEFEGMAEGADLPLQRVAEWTYIEECETPRCSGAICTIDGRAWVARNNDTYVPELWGYATVREVTGRIPAICFTLEGYLGTPTGINKDRLWLHYNFLPVWDTPRPGSPHIPCYIFLTEALETCRTIADVEAMLSATDRDGGMLLFAVDGKTQEFAIFECLCTEHFRRDPADGWIVGTNHYCTRPDPTLLDEPAASTLTRFSRMESLVRGMYAAPHRPTMPDDLIRFLGDDAIERRDEYFATAYANVACPGSGELWYTFGGHPAASAGNWQRLEWPWKVLAADEHGSGQ